MKVTIFGVGYVGLVQASVLAEVGHDVLCVDTNKLKIKNLNQGIIPIYEPNLIPIIKKNHKLGKLNFTINPKIGVEHSQIQLITVGTPTNKDGSVDLNQIIKVIYTISQYMNNHKFILNKSTVPVGTTNKMRLLMQNLLKKRNVLTSFDIIANPEFLKAGTAVTDCMYPERIIIGTDNKNVIAQLHELYKPFDKNNNKIILMDIHSAELTKYAANCMLATKISFINEISNLAELLDADIDKIRQGIGSDSRIGYEFIYPGCGYGGSCFPKDMRAMINISQNLGYQPKLLKAVEEINNYQKNKLINFIKYHFNHNLNNKIFALWGLSFKPNTDDIRESSSIVLMESLWNAGSIIQAFDPAAMPEVKRLYGHRNDLRLMNSKEEVLCGADALIICTEWQIFRVPDFNIIKASLKQPLIFDGRNLYNPMDLANLGFIYYRIGQRCYSLSI